MIKFATLLMLAIIVPGAKAQVCPSTTSVLTAVNYFALANPTYSLNPGGIISPNGVFTVTPLYTTTYTLYVTGTANGSLVSSSATELVEVPPHGTCSFVNPVILGCGSQSASIVNLNSWDTYPSPGGAMTFSFIAPGGSTVLSSGPFSINLSHTITVPGIWHIVLRDMATMCDTWFPLTVLQNTYAPIAVINGANNNGSCGSGTIETLANGSYLGSPPNMFPTPLGTEAILWEGPSPQLPATFVSIYQASVSGVYTMTVRDMNNDCISTATVNNFVRPVAAFVHTITGGQATFNDVSLNTNANTAYYWDFGDGTGSTAQNPTHTYLNGGAHLVQLIISNSGMFCSDTVAQSVNISGIPCSVNSGFSLVPTGTPQIWDAIPDYPWNIVAASWDWGDGTFSNTLYTSHQYASASIYNVCLSVTVSCVASSSTCTSYNVYRPAQSSLMVEIRVRNPELIMGLSPVVEEALSWDIAPNPNAGEFKINLNNATSGNIRVVISDLTGRNLRDLPVDSNSTFFQADTSDLPSGMYFVTLQTANLKTTKRMVVNR